MYSCTYVMLGLFGETYSVYGMSALLGERANNYMTANKFAPVETKDNVISHHLRQVKKDKFSTLTLYDGS